VQIFDADKTKKKIGKRARNYVALADTYLREEERDPNKDMNIYIYISVIYNYI